MWLRLDWKFELVESTLFVVLFFLRLLLLLLLAEAQAGESCKCAWVLILAAGGCRCWGHISELILSS